MNMPYDNAKDAVEFWQSVAAILGGRDHIKPWEVEDYTRDMLARCVLWLAERGVWVRPVLNIEYRAERSDGEDDFGRVERFGFITASKCIFTAHRDAVLAVSGEGGG